MNHTAYAELTMPGSGITGLAGFSITEVRGQSGVLACAPALVALAERCGLRGVMDHLAFQLSVPYFGSKLPSLFLLYPPPSQGYPTYDRVSSQREPFAAVLLHEYRLLGVRTGAYIPSDTAGDWTILAPADARGEVATYVANYLLDQGARVLVLSFSGCVAAPGDSAAAPNGSATAANGSSVPEVSLRAVPGAPRSARAAGVRPLLRTLHLHATVDETLVAMGSHTRRNLRLARRQAASQLQAAFHSEAELSEEEFLAINREGFYPVPDWIARWRYRSAHEAPGGFIAAARTKDGDWVALLGGRRYLSAGGPCTAVDWQMNHTRFSRSSPGSIMRILLIEHEVARGTTQLRFEGGTPHSMRSAFQAEFVNDLLFATPRIPTAALRLLGRVLPKGKLLGDLLTSPDLVWCN